MAPRWGSVPSLYISLILKASLDAAKVPAPLFEGNQVPSSPSSSSSVAVSTWVLSRRVPPRSGLSEPVLDLSLGRLISSGTRRALCWGTSHPLLWLLASVLVNPLARWLRQSPAGRWHRGPGAAPLLEARGSGGYVWLWLDLALGTLSSPEAGISRG